MLVLSFGMLIGWCSATAFAFVPDDVNSEAATETVQEESVAETPEENTKETNGDGFSVPGNGEVLDNITDDSSKEFILSQQQITILTIWSLTIQQQATTCICCPLLTKMI